MAKPKKVCKIPGCTNFVICLNLCSRHYKIQWKAGRKIKTPTTAEFLLHASRFWSRVNKGKKNDCWEWRGSTSQNGYGFMSVNYKNYTTHRLSWFFTYSGWPTLWVLHSCDNRKCVNPAHLREGTALDNANDAKERNRLSYGQQHHCSKLTEKDVLEVRSDRKNGYTQEALANKFNISRRAIRSLLSGKTWQHVK